MGDGDWAITIIMIFTKAWVMGSSFSNYIGGMSAEFFKFYPCGDGNFIPVGKIIMAILSRVLDYNSASVSSQANGLIIFGQIRKFRRARSGLFEIGLTNFFVGINFLIEVP